MVHPYLYNSILVLPLIQSSFGINGMFRPDAHLQALGFPPHTGTAHKLNRALMRIWAIRNLSVSFLIALVWMTGNEKLLGMSLGSGLAICITDGFVSRALIGGGEGQHWAFAPVIATSMAGLFGWF